MVAGSVENGGRARATSWPHWPDVTQTRVVPLDVLSRDITLSLAKEPNGWSFLVTSDEVPRDAVRRLRRFGRELVAFRDAAGKICVADAHCPHLGADLGGGSIVRGTLRCPFHGFRFDGDGQCVEVPTCERIPAQLALRTWNVRETNGLVLIWHHSDGESPVDAETHRRHPFAAAPKSWYHLAWSDELARGAKLSVRAFGETLVVRRHDDGTVSVLDASGRALPACEASAMVFVYHDASNAAPDFVVPEIPEATSTAWLPAGRIERVFRSHVQEIVENSIDIAHYQALHGFVGPTKLESLSVTGRTFTATLAAAKRVFGVAIKGRLKLAYYGMGFGIGRMELPIHVTNVVTCLPIDACSIRMRFTVYVKVPRIPFISRAIASLIRWHLWRDVEGELPVFETKRYLTRPMLVPGDGPILKIRSWCRQFYGSAGTT